MKQSSKVKKTRKVKAWCDIGSHGYIFAFENGNYPKMMHVYSEKVSPDLIPCVITYKI